MQPVLRQHDAHGTAATAAVRSAVLSAKNDRRRAAPLLPLDTNTGAELQVSTSTPLDSVHAGCSRKEQRSQLGGQRIPQGRGRHVLPPDHARQRGLSQQHEQQGREWVPPQQQQYASSPIQQLGRTSQPQRQDRSPPFQAVSPPLPHQQSALAAQQAVWPKMLPPTAAGRDGLNTSSNKSSNDGSSGADGWVAIEAALRRTEREAEAKLLGGDAAGALASIKDGLSTGFSPAPSSFSAARGGGSGGGGRGVAEVLRRAAGALASELSCARDYAVRMMKANNLETVLGLQPWVLIMA